MDVIDERRTTIDGITYTVFVVPDEDASIKDYDREAYDDATREAYGDTWQYVGVIVRPEINGVDASGAEDSLWAVEYGTAPGWERAQDMDYFLTVHPVPDMIGQVRYQLAELRDKITAALAGK